MQHFNTHLCNSPSESSARQVITPEVRVVQWQWQPNQSSLGFRNYIFKWRTNTIALSIQKYYAFPFRFVNAALYYHLVIVDIHAFQVQYRVSKWLERQILSTGQWLLRRLLCSWWCHSLSVRRIVLLLFRIVPTHNALHLHDNCYMCVSSCTLYSLHIQIYIKYVGLVRLLSSREPYVVIGRDLRLLFATYFWAKRSAILWSLRRLYIK